MKKVFQPRRNIRLSMLFGFTWMFLPVIPVHVPYLLSLGFSIKQFFELQAIFGLVVAICELPSGYAADLFGRKRVLILGAVVSALGFLYLVFARTYFDFIIYEILIGFGLSMASGADLSLMYDSQFSSDESGEPSVGSGSDLISRFFFFKLLAEAISSVFGGLLASISYFYVLLMTALVAWIPVLVGCLLQEPPVHRAELTTHLQNLKNVYQEVFTNSRLVRMLFFNYVIWSLSTFCAVWLIQKYWSDAKLGLIWFGVLWALFQVVAGVTGIWASKLERVLPRRKILALSAGLSIFGFIGLGILPTSLGIFVGVLFYLSRGFNSVIYGEALNARVSSQYRATINSLYSLLFRLVFMVIGPLIGWGLIVYGAKATFFALAFVLLIFAVLSFLPLYQSLTPHREGLED